MFCSGIPRDHPRKSLLKFYYVKNMGIKSDDTADFGEHLIISYLLWLRFINSSHISHGMRTTCGFCMVLIEQALGWFPLCMTLVVETKPDEFSFTWLTAELLATSLRKWSSVCRASRFPSGISSITDWKAWSLSCWLGTSVVMCVRCLCVCLCACSEWYLCVYTWLEQQPNISLINKHSPLPLSVTPN